VIGDPAAGGIKHLPLPLGRRFPGPGRLARDDGYSFSAELVQDAWYDGATLPEKPVVLSFDDGYLGQYLEAMPILRKKGWGGLLNLKAEGSDLNTTEVKKMMKAGWEIASHTITHLDLTSLDPAMLEDEVAGSKRQLETELGVDIDNFCYPAGKYDDTVIAAVEDALPRRDHDESGPRQEGHALRAGSHPHQPGRGLRGPGFLHVRLLIQTRTGTPCMAM
jgi:peptidoglycan/xylan/chitin deacetylase (PgdA/CDA1 family)